MLLRSASSPIVRSWGPNSPLPEPDTPPPHLPRTRSVLTSSFGSPGKLKKILRLPVVEECQPKRGGAQELVSFFLSEEGGGGGSDGRQGTDAYYGMMIEANPGNPLFLANYAKFLKEVKGDLRQAEEYYERAILASPNDGNVLSSYADLIWETHKDSARAEAYFDEAAKTDPNDCFVMASYARFLWDANEDEEEEAVESRYAAETNNKSPSDFHGGESHWPLAAAS